MSSRSKSSKLAQHAYEAVRDAIENGTLAPGDRISEYKTAEWLNISRIYQRLIWIIFVCKFKPNPLLKSVII